MNYKKAKLVALAAIPLTLTVAVVNVGQQQAEKRRVQQAAAATKELIANCNKEECTAALIDQGADVNVRDGFDNTPLHYAVSAATAKMLLDHGAVIDARNKNGCTPVFIAAAHCYVGLVRLLLQRGADPNIGLYNEGVKRNMTSGPMTRDEFEYMRAFPITPHRSEIIQLFKAAGAHE